MLTLHTSNLQKCTSHLCDVISLITEKCHRHPFLMGAIILYLYDKILNKTYLISGRIASTSKSLSAVCLFLLLPSACAQLLNRKLKDKKHSFMLDEIQKFINRWANVLSRLNILILILLSNPSTAAWLLQSTLTLYDSLNVYVSFFSTTGVCVGATENKHLKLITSNEFIICA